jgi:death-on-curing protein
MGGLDGIRDEGLLESALANPFHTFDGVDLYAYGLVCNHPVDGNKRVGTYVMLVLLAWNHTDADFSDGDVIRIGLELASARKRLLPNA